MKMAIIVVYLHWFVYKESLLLPLQKFRDQVSDNNGSEHMLKYGLLSSICKESTQNNPRVWPGLRDEL